MPAKRIRVAVVYGGRSGEHDVSCRSAASMMHHLDPDRYAVTPVRIDRDGVWRVRPQTTAGAPDTPLRSMAAALAVLRDVDVVFPALHGRYGEDGTIQSLLELHALPYVGNGVLASAAGIDKDVTKKLLRLAGLRVADGVLLRPDDDPLDQVAGLSLPTYVKPARGGSSLGVSRVEHWSELPSAVAVAAKEDEKILVEAAVPGREVDVGVLEFPDGRVIAGPPLEILVADGHSFFDYVAKYDDAGTAFQVPADLPSASTAAVRDLAVRAFHALGCRGLLRVDFFLPDAGEPVLNEVNTFPGFTAASQFPRMWAAAGLDYPALLDVLIETALRGR